MNSFRVINTKFRILKGGKIGLSFAIVLIGSISVGSVNSYATNYFDTPILTNYSNDGVLVDGYSPSSNSTNRGESTSDDIVFLPSGVTSSYVGIDGLNNSSIDGTTGTANFADSGNIYYYDTTSNQVVPGTIYTITFDTNANANNISKSDAQDYSVSANTAGLYITTPSIVLQNYIANLVFSGNNIVSGNTDIDNGTITLNGTASFGGSVTSSLIDVSATGTGTFNSNVNITSLNMTGTGTVILNSNLTGNVTTNADNQGILTTTGANQTITGNIGSSTSLDLGILNIGSDTVSANYSKTTINGNVFADSTVLNNNGTTNSSELIIASGKNITSTITTADANMGILTLAGGIQTVTGQVGNGNKLAEVNAGNGTSTFANDVYATNLDVEGTGTVNLDGDYTGTAIRYNADGTVILADTKNIDSSIINNTGTDSKGTLTLEGSSTVTGQVGDSTHSLKEINAGVAGSTSTFNSNVYASNLNMTGTGTVNLNGDTSSDIVFANGGTINVAEGKGILGSVQTLANNTGILNYNGDGTITGNIGSSITSGIKELNINTNNEQNTPAGVIAGVVGLSRELYADVVALKNNATLTLLDNTNMLNSGLGSDKIFITTDITNTGTLNFKGTSNITGEVGESDNVLNTINAGVTAEKVTFNDMVYATTLKYSNNGTVVLNGDTTSDTSEGIVGTVDLNNTTGTLEIGNDVNLTTGTSGIQFTNANSAILTFNGSSIVTGVLGGNISGNSTFERIYAGADSSTVTFKNDVYVEESNDTTLHVSGTGIVNFEGNLYGDLIFDADGSVNVSDTKSIITSTVPISIRTHTYGEGTINFEGTTTLYTDIGESGKILNTVNFATTGTSSDTYTQDMNKNIYAQNTTIGNGLNNTIVNITDNITFGGNLDVKKNSILNVSDYDIEVTDNLDIASNSTLKIKLYTTDISAGEAVENAKSGSIKANSISLASDTKINITYDGSWYGAGKYNLINATSSTGTYYGTESNGLVSDNSIIDSIVKNDGTNLTLFADRTGGGSYSANDLYIVKSGIGNHYSNGASQALAGYANNTQRDGALSDIIRGLEELQGGTIITADKKAEMIRTQKLLAPIANNSTIKSSLVASTTVLSTISDRISDIRVSSSPDFIPWGGDYSGLSSGDYMQDYALWIKVMGAKATQNKVKDYDGYETSTYGLVAGVDKTLRDGTTIGVALSNADTKINQTDFRTGDSSSTKSIQLTTYASKELGDTYVDGVISYGKHSTDGIRTANSGKLTSSVNADQITAKVETGYRVYFEDIATLTPFASFEYGMLNQKAYTEKGTTYQNDALKVADTKITKGKVGLGTKLSTHLNVGNVIIVPEVKFAVYNAIGDKNADIKAQYTGGGNEFVTPTQDLTDTMYKAGLGIKTTLSQSTSLMLGVDYDRSKDGSFQGYSGNASFRLNF